MADAAELPPLIGGPYHAPACQVGEALECIVMGKQVVQGMTNAPIAWPYRRAANGDRRLYLTGDLVTAVCVESAMAVREHWGISRSTVQRWRRRLGVQQFNEGTMEAWRRVGRG